MTMITPLVLLVFFFVFDWKLGLVSLVPMLIGLGLMSTMMGTKNQQVRDAYYKQMASLSAETVEYVRAIPVVKTFAQSVESFDRLYSLIQAVKQTNLKWSLSYRNKMSMYEVLVGSTAFFLVPVAILLITNGADEKTVVSQSVIYFWIRPTFGFS